MNAQRTLPRSARRDRLWPDLATAAAVAALVVLAAVVGRLLKAEGIDVFAPSPPLYAGELPRTGPGTLPALMLAVLVVLRGPDLAARLPWRWLLGLAFLAGVAWTLALALVDGWEVGVAGRLTVPTEYLTEVPGVTDVGAAVDGFAERIPRDLADSWNTHVAAHPPAALLVFVWLDRVGLGGGGAAGLACIAVGASAAVAVAATLRALGAEAAARAALPFGVLFPGAIWVGVSADAIFAGVFAWGVALLALGAARRDRAGDVLAAASGLLLGFALHLSYGLAAAGLIPLAVILVARRWRALWPAAAGGIAVFAAFTAAGFWWFEGLELTRILYYTPGSLGTERPYGYWVWAALAAFAVAVGPATVAGLRRVLAGMWAPPNVRTPPALVALTVAALVAVAIANLSGLSRGEVERIWLPFAVWLVAATAMLPARSVRSWLAVQAAVALVVGHVVAPPW
jgi:hypothetical protein